MSEIKQEIFLANGGLNSDDDEKFLPLGDGIARRNINVSGVGQNGVLTNVNGTTAIEFPISITEYLIVRPCHRGATHHDQKPLGVC